MSSAAPFPVNPRYRRYERTSARHAAEHDHDAVKPCPFSDTPTVCKRRHPPRRIAMSRARRQSSWGAPAFLAPPLPRADRRFLASHSSSAKQRVHFSRSLQRRSELGASILPFAVRIRDVILRRPAVPRFAAPAATAPSLALRNARSPPYSALRPAPGLIEIHSARRCHRSAHPPSPVFVAEDCLLSCAPYVAYGTTSRTREFSMIAHSPTLHLRTACGQARAREIERQLPAPRTPLLRRLARHHRVQAQCRYASRMMRSIARASSVHG